MPVDSLFRYHDDIFFDSSVHVVENGSPGSMEALSGSQHFFYL